MIIRGPRRIWLGGGWRTFVPIAVLGGLYVGTRYFWPDGYVDVARPVCGGLTPQGCVLRWQSVELEGGGTVDQCVQLCPRADAAPPVPPPAVAAPLPVAPAAGACMIDIFAEPNFAGTSDQTDESQPGLGEWDKSIGSVEVKAGTWDFYSEPDFKGDVMRLAVGRYGDLGPSWSKQIGSFRCLDK